MYEHLLHMAEVRPAGRDLEAVRWALAEIDRLKTELAKAQEKAWKYDDLSK